MNHYRSCGRRAVIAVCIATGTVVLAVMAYLIGYHSGWVSGIAPRVGAGQVTYTMLELDPWDPQTNTINVSIGAYNVQHIQHFAIDQMELRDLTGTVYPWRSAVADTVKGGADIRVYWTMDASMPDQLVATGRIVLNDDLVRFVCRYRRRTREDGVT